MLLWNVVGINQTPKTTYRQFVATTSTMQSTFVVEILYSWIWSHDYCIHKDWDKDDDNDSDKNWDKDKDKWNLPSVVKTLFLLIPMSILSTNSLASIQNVWSDYILLVVFIADADDVDEDGDEEQKKD